jgi:hypothetical protein
VNGSQNVLRPNDPSRDLLFGLLARQNGLIDQGGLFSACAAWTREKSRPLADHLIELGHLDAPRRAAARAIAGVHVQAFGGNPEKSIGVLSIGRSVCERLAKAGGTDVLALWLAARQRPLRETDSQRRSARLERASGPQFHKNRAFHSRVLGARRCTRKPPRMQTALPGQEKC